MTKKILPLTMIGPGRTVEVVAISGGVGLRRRLNDMGLNEGEEIKVVQALYPGPCVIAFKGTRLVLGGGMGQKILVTPKE